MGEAAAGIARIIGTTARDRFPNPLFPSLERRASGLISGKGKPPRSFGNRGGEVLRSHWSAYFRD